MKAARALILALACVGALAGLIVRQGRTRAADAAKADAAPAPTAMIDASKYATLQAALDAIPAGGGLVRLPPGRFELTAPLVLTRGDVRIEGCGGATHLVNRNESGEPALLIRAAGRARKKTPYVWRVQVADIRISGNPKSGDGLRAERVNEIYLHGLSVDHNGAHGVNLISCTEDPRVCDSILTYNAEAGLNIQAGHDIVVNGNQFEENQDAVRCLDSFNLCMNGNNLDDHLRHGVVIEKTYGSVLSGNMIEECRDTAVVLDRDCYGITVSANVIAHNFGGGVDLRDAWGCAISANTFTIVARRAVAVDANSGRIAITGNSFSNAHIGGKVRRDDAAAGVVLTGTSDIVVTGNAFTGMAGEAVRADAQCRRIVVAGNVAADLNRKQAEAKLPALNLRGAADTVVADNAIEEKR